MHIVLHKRFTSKLWAFILNYSSEISLKCYNYYYVIIIFGAIVSLILLIICNVFINNYKDDEDALKSFQMCLKAPIKTISKNNN